MARKTFNEKLNDSRDMPKIVVLDDVESIKRYGGSRMLIAPPIEYDDIMRKVPEGKILTSDRLRSYLARKHNADFTCPLTAGIFINIAAHASAERAFDKTPYWRTLRKDGELNEKYPGGLEVHAELLEQEGHVIIHKGKKAYVKDFEENLYEID